LLIGLILLDLGPVSIIFTALIIMGIGVGAEGGGITSYFVARYFGLKAFGEIYGYISAATIVSLGVGPVMAGMLFDITGSYGLSLKIMDIALVIAIAAVMFLGPYVYDVRPAKRR
jgi:MFS family permease